MSFGEEVGQWLEEGMRDICGADNVLFLNIEAVFILWEFIKLYVYEMYMFLYVYYILIKVNNNMVYTQQNII